MHTSHSIKACAIAVSLAVVACGGGGGDPGISPHANNSPTTKLHPEVYVERWWPGCEEGNPCIPPAAP